MKCSSPGTQRDQKCERIASEMISFGIENVHIQSNLSILGIRRCNTQEGLVIRVRTLELGIPEIKVLMAENHNLRKNITYA